MSIILDFMGHLSSTESAEELHEFARKIGLKKSWYQTPGFGEKHAHYDLTTKRMIAIAKANGAEFVSPFDLVKRAWWSDGKE